MNKCFIFHKWSAWSDVTRNSAGYLVQFRFCHKCRKADMRYVGNEPQDDTGYAW